MNKKLIITICATRSYTYAMLSQARKVIACISTDGDRWKEGMIILSGDDSNELREVYRFYHDNLPEGWTVQHLAYRHKDGLPNYQKDAQLLIARMRSSAFDAARKLRADLCWSLDSDVLPPENALRCMADLLDFDNGDLYQIATCPYNSQGGGDFLGGRGTITQNILPDIFEDERLLSRVVRRRTKALKKWEAREKAAGLKQPSPELANEYKEVKKLVDNCPATGDVFFRNSSSGAQPLVRDLKQTFERRFKKQPKLLAQINKLIDGNANKYKTHGFRRRGWASSAYPALGWGSIVPTDWHGFGCTLMSKKALALAQFEGYEGLGTEDLYVIWKRWHRNKLNIGLILHAPCDHVVRTDEGPYMLCQAYFEELDPECVGHLRTERRPWKQQTLDES